MTRPFTLDLAWTIARRLAAARGCELAGPDDPRRAVLLYALGAVHALTGSAWSVDHARWQVSVTLPAVGPALSTLLAVIPYVGAALAEVARRQTRTTVYLSPVAVSSPTLLLATVAHELGHVDQIAAGGLAWCAAFGVVPEVRAAAESCCYGQDVTVVHALRGDDPKALCDGAMESLKSYGLDADATVLARGVLDVVRRTLEHGGVPGGPCEDVLNALRAAGCLAP